MTGPIIPGYGNRKARIVLLGEAPARNEEREGKPFVGKAGQELDRLLGSAGIRREDCYLTNASLRAIRLDKKEKKDKWFFEKGGRPTQVFLEGMAQLQMDLNEIRPNVVVPLGNYALWAMMQHTGIMNWRGSILWSDVFQVKVVPTIHPAALLYGSEDDLGADAGGLYKYRPIIIWDLEKAKEQSAFPDVRLVKREIHIVQDISKSYDAIDRLRAAEYRVFDSENFKGPKLACIGFGDGDPNWSCVIPYYQSSRVMSIYKELLEDDVPKGGQNLMHDVTYFDQLGINTRNVVDDSMIGQHTIMPDLPKGLDFLTSIYTDMPYFKEEGKIWKMETIPNINDFWRYNGKDVQATTQSIQSIREYLLSDPALLEAYRRRIGMFEILRTASRNGMRVDKDLFFRLIKEVEATRDKAQAELNRIAGYAVNAKSTPQVAELLYGERGLPPRYAKGADGEQRLTTKEKVIMDLATQTKDPAILNVVIVRQTRTLLERYYKESLLSPDDRMRYLFNIVGTLFGRMSSSAPLWGPGTNIQNQPHASRRIYMADEGWELAEYDQAQAEAVITAYLANDPVHLHCFWTGIDVHRATAALLQDWPLEDWTKIDKEANIRQLAKKCNHGLNYGMGAHEFMLTVNDEWDPTDPESLSIDIQLAEALHRKYLSVRPALNSYWDWVRNQLRENDRTLRTLLGWPIQFLGYWNASLLKQAYSAVPQGTVGECTNVGIMKFLAHPEAKKAGARLVMQGHDSAIFTWPKECRKDLAPIAMRMMQIPLQCNGYQFVIPIDGMAGPRWSKKEMDSLGSSSKVVTVETEVWSQLYDESVEAMGKLRVA